MNRFRMTSTAVVACLLFAGCEVPTDPPIVEQRWIVPIEETTMSVDELLPTGVVVSGNDFSVSMDPFSSSQALANLCGACTALNGLTTPVPAFTSSFNESEDLPDDVTAAMISIWALSRVLPRLAAARGLAVRMLTARDVPHARQRRLPDEREGVLRSPGVSAGAKGRREAVIRWSALASAWNVASLERVASREARRTGLQD